MTEKIKIDDSQEALPGLRPRQLTETLRWCDDCKVFYPPYSGSCEC